MVWRDAIGALDPGTIVILQENEPDARWSTVERMGRGGAWPEEAVCFAPASSLPRFTGPGPAGLVVLRDGALPEGLGGNAAVYEDEGAYEDAWARLSALSRRAFWLSERFRDLAEYIAGERGLDGIAQRISEMYGHPAAVYDNTFQLLGHSDRAGFLAFGSGDLLGDIDGGCVPHLAVRQVQDEQAPAFFTSASPRPSLVYHPGGQFKHYVTPVLIGTTVAGSFSVYLPMDGDLDALGLEYLERLAKLLSITMQRSDFYASNKAHFYARFFASVLADGPDRDRDWENRIQGYGYVLRPCMHVVAARFPSSVHTRVELNNLVSALHHLLPGSIYYVQSDLIVLFCSNDPGQFTLAPLLGRGGAFLQQNRLRLGVSSEFHAMADIRRHYDQARSAIEAGRRYFPWDSVHFYDDLRPCCMVCALALRGEDLDSYCYPPFMELFERDRERGTQLCQTLFYYLMDPKNTKKVCEKLHIHKNTLYFRLDKAQQVMGQGVEKASASAQIFLTVLVLRYQERIDWELYEPPKALQAEREAAGRGRHTFS